MAPVKTAPAIRFEATLQAVGPATILRLPARASQDLPSRGQVSVRGAIAGQELETVVEPDGEFGHWIRVDPRHQRAAGIGPGDTVAIELSPTLDWPEPEVPGDLAEALAAAPQPIRETWRDITPMARWEWVRWVNATRSPQTRRRRVEVSISKLQGGKRRPCCFNLASCTDPDLSKSGKLVRSI